MKTEKQNEIRSLKGLNEREVEKSKELYGTNELAQKPKASILSMFLDACNNIWIKVLFAALIMKVIMILIGWSTGNDIYQVISIIVAIALSTGFSTLTEYKNTSRADALQEEYNRTYAKVMRSGKLVNILTSELVKGDVILIQAGDKVPVDGLLIKGHIAVSQAALNGESRDEKKFAAKDMLNAESTDYGSSFSFDIFSHILFENIFQNRRKKMRKFKEEDVVFVSNPDKEYEKEYGIRTHRNFFGKVIEVVKTKPYDCITVDFGNNEEWAYNANELSLAKELKDMTLEEFSNKYLVCINATYLY